MELPVKLIRGLQCTELNLALVPLPLWAQINAAGSWLHSRRISVFIHDTNGAAWPPLKMTLLSNVQGIPITEEWKFLQNTGKYGPASSILIWPAMEGVWKAGIAEMGLLSSGFLTNSSEATQRSHTAILPTSINSVCEFIFHYFLYFSLK